MFEGAIGSGETPTLAALAARGSYRRATSVFPSLTPVCLSSIATGAHGDIHEIPHLVWYDRSEERTRRVRQLVRSRSRRRDRPDPARHAREHEPAAPRRRRPHPVRVTCRRGPPHGGRQLHRLPGPHAAPVVAAAARRRDGAGAVLLLQPVQLRSHRRAALLAQPAGGIDRRLCGGGRPLARDPRRLRLPRLLPLRLRLRLPRARSRYGARDAAALRRRDRRARRGGRRARRVPRALRGGRDGRPRPDQGARGNLARRGLRRRRRRPAARLQSRRAPLPPARLPARPARGRRPPRRGRRPPR